jgi:hypothetical protein
MRITAQATKEMVYVRRGWLMGHNGRAHGLSNLRTIEEGSMLELFRYIAAPFQSLNPPNFSVWPLVPMNMFRDIYRCGVDRFKFKETEQINSGIISTQFIKL